MCKVLIVADDITGANANCALMKIVGLRTASMTGNFIEKLPFDIDVVAFSTNSRAMSKDVAYKSVYNTVLKYKNDSVEIFSKRIDSTLRGNLGSELKAYQDALGDNRLAICVPAFPNSNRIVINDFMYVNGRCLMDTDAGKDSKISCVSNFVTKNFIKDYDGNIVHIGIEEIDKGLENIRENIKKNKDCDLLIFDAITNEQIALIAEASISSKINFISVDPGPFTKELTKLLYKNKSISTKAIAIIGSVTNVTIEQMKVLKKSFNYCQIDVNPNKLINVYEAIYEINRAIYEVRKNLKNYQLFIVTTTPQNINDRLDLKKLSEKLDMSLDDISLMISRALAKIGKEIVTNENSISGLFLSGGDVTVAVVEELLSDGIEIKEEIQPLVAYGRIINGLKPGLKIISKGGMVGDKNVMVECIQKILKKGE